MERIKRLWRIGYNRAKPLWQNADLPRATDGIVELAVMQQPLPVGNICF
jgi:hypothetical protein